jgi:outer membrane protein OmpA-like peptidoglycan-associated protein
MMCPLKGGKAVRRKGGRALGKLRRTVLVAFAFLAAWKAEDAFAQTVQDLRFDVQDLRFDAGDLRFDIQDLRFDVQDLEFLVEDITEPPEESDREITFRLSADVLFDFDSADLRPEADSMLGRLAERIRNEFPEVPVRVEGHTDSKGADEYNQALSLRRAESVKTWLVERGEINADRVATVGVGELQPVAPNQNSDGSDDPIGRQQNRRVEIVVERG